MKAIVATGFGSPDVLRLKEVSIPVPRDNEVLINIYATTVTAGDCEIRSLKIPLLFRVPMRIYMGLKRLKKEIILGQELAGKIVSLGEKVTLFRKGDAVFAITDMLLSSYAEYTCLPEDAVILQKPKNMSFEAAAAVPVGGLNVLSFLKKAEIKGG
jgi:NADPH:quinone reductase-like Zn-dependent oxidoreductase